MSAPISTLRASSSAASKRKRRSRRSRNCRMQRAASADSSASGSTCATHPSSISSTTRRRCGPAASRRCSSNTHRNLKLKMTTTTTTTSQNPEVAAREVAERIRAGHNFLITSHRNPDGDALGSGIALQRLIRKLGKQSKMVVRDGFAKPLMNIPGANEVAISDTLPADYPNAYDALFTMECPEIHRTGYRVLPGPVVNIDHRLGNEMYGEINYLDIDAPSVGEMVLQLNN